MTILLIMNIVSCVVFTVIFVIMLRTAYTEDDHIDAIILLLAAAAAGYWILRSLDQIMTLLAA